MFHRSNCEVLFCGGIIITTTKLVITTIYSPKMGFNCTSGAELQRLKALGCFSFVTTLLLGLLLNFPSTRYHNSFSTKQFKLKSSLKYIQRIQRIRIENIYSFRFSIASLVQPFGDIILFSTQYFFVFISDYHNLYPILQWLFFT